MPSPLTADVRQNRITSYLRYLQTQNRSLIAEYNLTRMNRVANFRRDLLKLLNDLIEARAEEIAARALEQLALPGPPRRAGKGSKRLTYVAQPSRWHPAKHAERW